MEKYRYPMLTASEIFSHLRYSLNIINCAEEDVTKPKAESIREIYLELLIQTFHKSRDEFIKPTASEFDMFKYPDTVETGVMNVKLFIKLSKLFNYLGCRDDPFRLNDLLNPDFKRTRKFLSAFINFIRFQAEEQDILNGENNKILLGKVSAEEIKKLQDEKDKLNSEIQALERFQAENSQAITQKTQMIADLENEKAKILEERRVLEEKMALLLNEVENSEALVKTMEDELQKIREKKQVLQQEIVENPDDLKALIKEKRDKYKESIKLKDQDKEASDEARLKLERMDELLSKIREASILIDTIEMSHTKYKDLCKTLEMHKQESFVIERCFVEKSLEYDALVTNSDRDGVRQDHDRKVTESRLQKVDASLDSKRNELEYLSKQKQDLLLDYIEKKKICENLETQFRTMEEKHIQAMKQLKDEHEKTIEKAQIYSKKIMEILRNPELFKTYQMPMNNLLLS